MKISFNKKIAAYIFGGLVIFISATLFFIYSQLRDVDNFKNLVVEKIEEITGRKVSVGKAELGFEKGISISLKQLSIYSSDGKNQEFSAKNAWCVIKLWPLFNKEVEIKKFILNGASVELIRNEQGKFNFGDPLSLLTEQSSSRLFKLLGAGLMHRLSVLDSEVKFRDYYGISGSEPLLTVINGINLGVNKRFFQNAFSFNLNGRIPNKYQTTVFEFSGGIDNFKNVKRNQPIPLKGKIKVDQLYLDQLRPYLKKILPIVSDDIKLSLETDISGSLGDKLRAKGGLKYSRVVMGQKSALGSVDSPDEGKIDYSLELDKDSIEIQNFKIRSGQSNFSGNGKLIGYKTKDPDLSFGVQADEFSIKETRQKFPLTLIPKTVHEQFHELFSSGTLGIKSLQFDGSFEQLKNIDSEENKDRITAEIYFKGMDWRSPLPLFKAVTGSFDYKNGDGFIEIMKARYEGFPLSNIKGTVKNIMNKPLLDLSMKSELDLDELNRFLKKSIRGQSFESIIDDYQEVEGKGLIEAKLKGSLNDKEKTSMTAVLSVKSASFFDTELQSRVRNFNGKLHFNYVPLKNRNQTKSSTPIVEAKNLSGEFGKSEFYNMDGKILRQGEKIVQKIEAVYRFNAAELAKVIAGIDFSGPEFSLLKQAEFEEGDVEVQYRSLMDFDKPEKEQSWGEIKLKNISIKHFSDFQPIARLVGEISFGDGRIDINKAEGLYGGSPISLKGQMIPKSGSLIDFDMRANLTDWTETNLKGIPYFEKLKFSGPLNLEINISGNRHSFKFKNKSDLTKSGYELKEIISKKENIPNLFEMEGSYSEAEGILFNQFKFALDGNSMRGEAKLKSFSNPEYSIKLSGVGFKANAMKRMVNFFDNSTDGKIDFQVLGQGNLNKPEDSFFKGSAVLKDLVFKWEDRKNPLTFSANARFSGNTYDLRSGRMESGRSKISFRGKYKNEEQPELLLKLTGETLIVDELISNKKSEDKDEISLKDLFNRSNLLSKGKSKISIDLKQLDYKWLTLADVSGTVLLKDKEIIFNRFRIGPNNAIKGQGKFSVKNPESISFETRMKADEIQANEFLAMFGEHFREGLTGKFKNLKLILKSRGEKFSENIRNLNGKLSFGLANGVIDTKKLHEGVFSLFDLEQPLETKNKKDKDQEPSKYESISGDFIYTGGVAETNNLVYETDQRKSAIAGKFDLNDLEMDTVVGVAHLPGLDKLLTQIPIVGSILTAGDEGSLIKTYYDVNGPFDNPEVTAIPFTSLSKKFIGLFQGVLQTSEEILSLPEQIGAGEITD
ncbi:hypothetical protein M1N16_04720 [Nitrospinaceae bacterium]|nr:hypothetical protein [Nitrospinaceae bacterium]